MGDRVFQEVRKPFNHTDFDMKLVTGHEGFIGKRLKARLEETEEVVGIEQDFWDAGEAQLSGLVSKCSGVYHIGANSSTTYTNPDIFRTNFLQSIQLLKWCEWHNVRMVFASTAAIYGTEGEPQNFYAWTKLCTELVGNAYNRAENFIALRYFNVYGPGEENKGRMASVAYQAHQYYKTNNKPFKLFTGSPKRDFVYVDDVVDASIHAMAQRNLPKLPYDVGTAHARPFEDLLDGMGLPYEHYDRGISEEIKPKGYQEYTEANANLFLPGWEPKYNLEQGTKLYREYLDGR